MIKTIFCILTSLLFGVIAISSLLSFIDIQPSEEHTELLVPCYDKAGHEIVNLQCIKDTSNNVTTTKVFLGVTGVLFFILSIGQAICALNVLEVEQ